MSSGLEFEILDKKALRALPVIPKAIEIRRAIGVRYIVDEKILPKGAFISGKLNALA